MTGSISILEAPTAGIGSLIADNRFFVPTHQRDYKWDRDRVEKFFDDLAGALERGDRLYFIGLMVFMRDADGRLRVLDGQQRLATVIVAFSALRAWFGTNDAESTGDADTHGRLQYDFIGRSEYGDKRPAPKLSLNLNNNDIFQSFVVQGSPIHLIREAHQKTGKNDSNYNLLDAIVYTHERIAKMASEHSIDASLYFAKLIKFLRDAVIVVRLTVPNESNAFKVFETLNDRGMDLSAIDLVKNYLFGLAYEASEQSLRQMEHRWTQFSETLKESKEEEFLKTFWTSRYGLAYANDLFDGVKDVCKTPEQAQAMSQDMLEASEHFAALNSSDDVVWKPYSDRCRKLIDDLRLLGTKLVRPVILAGIKRLDPKEFERLLWLLQVVIVRWQIVRGGRPGVIERTCARLAQGIWRMEIKTAKEAKTVLAEPYQSDDEFRDWFQLFKNAVGSKTAYLLRKLEEDERQIERGPSAGDLKPARLSLEHILPKNAGSEWAEVTVADPNIVAECAEMIGNLCLISESRNRDLGRTGFAKKKVVFADADILTTRKLSDKAIWDRKEILHRQAHMASRAVEIWKVAS